MRFARHLENFVSFGSICYHEKALQKIGLLEFEITQMRHLIFGVNSKRFIASEALDPAFGFTFGLQ